VLGLGLALAGWPRNMSALGQHTFFSLLSTSLKGRQTIVSVSWRNAEGPNTNLSESTAVIELVIIYFVHICPVIISVRLLLRIALIKYGNDIAVKSVLIYTSLTMVLILCFVS